MATEEIDGLPADLDRIPAELGELKDDVRRWGVRDEAERTRRIEQSSTDELAAFWLRASQQLPAINSFLEAGIAGEPSNEALVLGATAEAALAAAAEVERRTGERPAA